MYINEDIILELHKLSDNYFHLLPKEIIDVIIDKQYDTLISPTFEQIKYFLQHSQRFIMKMHDNSKNILFNEWKIRIYEKYENRYPAMELILFERNRTYLFEIYKPSTPFEPYISTSYYYAIKDFDTWNGNVIPRWCFPGTYLLSNITLYRYYKK